MDAARVAAALAIADEHDVLRRVIAANAEQDALYFAQQNHSELRYVEGFDARYLNRRFARHA
jgi:hypothetical protein